MHSSIRRFSSSAGWSDEKIIFPEASIELTSATPAFLKTWQTSAIFILVPFTLTPRRKAQYFISLN